MQLHVLSVVLKTNGFTQLQVYVVVLTFSGRGQVQVLGVTWSLNIILLMQVQV